MIGDAELKAELEAIDLWDKQYRESHFRYGADEETFEARQKRKSEILKALKLDVDPTLSTEAKPQ